MKRFIVVFWLFLVLVFIKPAFSQPRYTTCDACGMCVDKDGNVVVKPESWEKCAACLYPGASGLETLTVDPATGLPPAPAAGNYYTAIGCINTNLGDFTQPYAAASLTKKLLDLIFGIAGGVAFLYLIYGAFLILTSQSNPERLEQGKSRVYGAIVGLIFVLFIVFIINFIVQQVLRLPSPDVGVVPTPSP
ncbi:MAG: pilin [Microgenomates group bacterium]|nr:pilin [Microgenomates group bacterium]